MADEINTERMNERLEQLAEYFDRYGGAMADSFAELKNLTKGTKAYNDAQDRLWKKLKSGIDDLNKSVAKGTATIDEFQDQIDKLEDAIENVTDAEQKEALERTKGIIQERARQQALSEAVAKTTESLTKNTIEGTGKLVRGLQDHASATEISSNVLNAAIEFAGESIKSFGDLLITAGNIFGKGTGSKIAKLTGGVIKGAGEAATNLLKFSNTVLSKEVEKTVKSFETMTSAGAVFADGMDGMRAASAEAGLTLDQYSKVVKSNADSLANTGMGMTNSVRMLGGVSKALRDSGLRENLMRLGYGVEEQAELAAQVMSDMRASQTGPLRATREQIATETAKYAENLRIISAITGEDAKKKMDQVRQQSTQLAFQQKLAGMDETQRQNVIEAMGNMSELQRKNYMDMVVFGNVINKEGAAAQVVMPGLRKSVEESMALTRAGNLTADEQRRINAKFGEEIQKGALQATSIGLAGAANVGGFAQALAEVIGKELDERKRMTKESIEQAEKDAKEAQTATGQLTTSVVNAQLAVQDLANNLENVLTPAVGKYAEASELLLTTIEDMLRSMGMPVGGRTGMAKQAEIEEKTKEASQSMARDIEARDKAKTERARIAKILEEDAKKSSMNQMGFLQKKYQEGRLNALDKQLDAIDNRLKRKRDEIEKLSSDSKTVGAMAPAQMSTIKTKSGKEALVNQTDQQRFQGFINDLEAAGYTIKDLQGFSDRNIAGTGTKSQHAYGRAIDINPTTNPELANRLVTDMPSNVGEIAKKWGLGWGGDWQSKKDPMHFSASPAEGGREMSLEETNRLLAEQNKKLDKLADTMADGNRDRRKIVENTR